jgi:hypothetical protein
MEPDREPDRDLSDDRDRSSLERFFVGLSECIFHSRLGVVDVQLVDYIGDMMLRFVRVDGVHRVRKGDGRPATEVFQMLCEAEQRIGLARREVHRHIGDFTLFWTGMYPESLRRMKSSSADHFLDYCRQGKRAYAIAAEIEAGDDRPSRDVLQSLSDHFEMCAYGLREIRREWEEGDNGEGLLL